jgi:hypothetical protein
MEYVTPRNVTNRRTSGNGVFYAVHAVSDVVQQYKNCWKRYSLWIRAEAVPGESKQLNQSNPCGGGLEYLHRDPASRRRRL